MRHWLASSDGGMKEKLLGWGWPALPESVWGQNTWVFAWTVCANIPGVRFRGPKGRWSRGKLGWTTTCQGSMEGISNQVGQRGSSPPPRNCGWESPGKENRVSAGHVEGPRQRESAGNVSHASRAGSQLTTVPVNKALPCSSMPKASEH